MIRNILAYFEKKTFGVCEWWGNKLGIKVGGIRLFFIYLSFLTFGSPLVIYLIMAFMLEHKKFFKFSRKKKSIWNL